METNKIENKEQKLDETDIEAWLDEDENEEEEYWIEHTLRKHIYENDEGKPYMRILKTDFEEPPYIAQKYENGKFKGSTKGMLRIPYKLPELIKGVKEGKAIFITNGEKDADTLTELGFVATTAPFTSVAKWNSVCNKYVKDAKVIIVKESSKEGKEFAETTFNRVRRVAKVSKTLVLEKICTTLNIKLNPKTDLTEIRETLQDDEKFKMMLKSVERKL